jgi:hypothetical protein
MSDTDFDDEDLSAPPKKHIVQITETAKDGAVEYDSADETADEEIQELSPDEYRTSLKRKHGSTPSPLRKVDKYSPIVRRQAHQGMSRRLRLSYFRW